MRGNHIRRLKSLAGVAIIALSFCMVATPAPASELSPSWNDVPRYLKEGEGAGRQGDYCFATGMAEISHIRADKAHEIARKKSLLRALRIIHVAVACEDLISTLDNNEQKQFPVLFAHLVPPSVMIEGIVIVRQREEGNTHYTTVAAPVSSFAGASPSFENMGKATEQYLAAGNGTLEGLTFCLRHTDRYTRRYKIILQQIGTCYRKRGQTGLAMCFLPDSTDAVGSPEQRLLVQNRLYRASQLAETAEQSSLKNRWDEAIDRASRALELAPTCTAAYLILTDYFLKEEKQPLFAICAAEKGMRDGTRADDAMEKVIKAMKMVENPEAELYRYMRDHRDKTAMDIISLESTFPIAYLVSISEGQAIDGEGQTPGGTFREAAELYGKAEKDEDVEKILHILFQACNEQPRGIQTYNLIGACYRHLGRPEMAISFLLQALALDPEYDYALTNLALCCAQLGLMKSADYYFEREAVRSSSNEWVRGRYYEFQKNKAGREN